VQTLRLTFNGTPQAGSPYLLDLRSFTLDLREPGPNALSALTAESDTGLGAHEADSAFSATMQTGVAEKFVWNLANVAPNDAYAMMISAMSELNGLEAFSQAGHGAAADPHLPFAAETDLGLPVFTDAQSGIAVPKALFSTPTHFNVGVRFAMPMMPDPGGFQLPPLEQASTDPLPEPLSPALGELELLMHIA
jgi:hypothetical protein